MLPPYIIDQLRRREQAKREAEAERPRPLLELPLGPPPGLEPAEVVVERGVAILDIF